IGWQSQYTVVHLKTLLFFLLNIHINKVFVLTSRIILPDSHKCRLGAGTHKHTRTPKYVHYVHYTHNTISTHKNHAIYESEALNNKITLAGTVVVALTLRSPNFI